MSTLRRVVTIASNDLDLLRRDPLASILLVGMPLVVMAFIKESYAPVLQRDHPGANGAEQVVPGMAVMFGVFIVTFAGLAFFREHIWGTWDRVRALPLGRAEIIAGKLGPTFAILCLQQALLFGAGHVLFGLHVRGSLLALCVVDLAFVVWLMGLSFAALAIAGTFQQLLAISNMGAIVLAGVGGALTPISTLPGWAEAVAPATPTYWAMRGFNGVILEGHSLAAEGKPIAILVGFAIGFFLLGALRFRFDAPKGGTL